MGTKTWEYWTSTYVESKSENLLVTNLHPIACFHGSSVGTLKIVFF